jgi:hypothetical protein
MAEGPATRAEDFKLTWAGRRRSSSFAAFYRHESIMNGTVVLERREPHYTRGFVSLTCSARLKANCVRRFGRSLIKYIDLLAYQQS